MACAMADGAALASGRVAHAVRHDPDDAQRKVAPAADATLATLATHKPTPPLRAPVVRITAAQAARPQLAALLVADALGGVALCEPRRTPADGTLECTATWEMDDALHALEWLRPPHSSRPRDAAAVLPAASQGFITVGASAVVTLCWRSELAAYVGDASAWSTARGSLPGVSDVRCAAAGGAAGVGVLLAVCSPRAGVELFHFALPDAVRPGARSDASLVISPVTRLTPPRDGVWIRSLSLSSWHEGDGDSIRTELLGVWSDGSLSKWRTGHGDGGETPPNCVSDAGEGLSRWGESSRSGSLVPQGAGHPVGASVAAALSAKGAGRALLIWHSDGALSVFDLSPEADGKPGADDGGRLEPQLRQALSADEVREALRDGRRLPRPGASGLEPPSKRRPATPNLLASCLTAHSTHAVVLGRHGAYVLLQLRLPASSLAADTLAEAILCPCAEPTLARADVMRWLGRAPRGESAEEKAACERGIRMSVLELSARLEPLLSLRYTLMGSAASEAVSESRWCGSGPKALALFASLCESTGAASSATRFAKLGLALCAASQSVLTAARAHASELPSSLARFARAHTAHETPRWADAETAISEVAARSRTAAAAPDAGGGGVLARDAPPLDPCLHLAPLCDFFLLLSWRFFREVDAFEKDVETGVATVAARWPLGLFEPQLLLPLPLVPPALAALPMAAAVSLSAADGGAAPMNAPALTRARVGVLYARCAELHQGRVSAQSTCRTPAADASIRFWMNGLDQRLGLVACERTLSVAPVPPAVLHGPLVAYGELLEWAGLQLPSQLCS